ncbi:MAG: hypothetical protein PHZ04_03020 [Patescibacteria group bacterium]|nr:hypothetical protein [Patescibacteria group bacterium]MDD5294378.1 hypothetical protein [Patescibacteria group bacterium]MDD5554675.1 hypothetical protein [Patescibacteria group bacterium]
MIADLAIKTVQVSDGTGMIPTATLVFATPRGEEKISCASQGQENIHHAIFRAIKEMVVSCAPDLGSDQEITLLACGANLPYRGGCKAHAHIQIGSNGDSRRCKRNDEHPTNSHMAVARAMLNCFQDLMA